MAREIEIGDNLSFLLVVFAFFALLCFLAWSGDNKKSDSPKQEAKTEAAK